MIQDTKIYDKVMDKLLKEETEFNVLGEDSIIRKFHLCIEDGVKAAVISELLGERTHQYSGLFETGHYDSSRLNLCYYKNNVGELYGKVGNLPIPKSMAILQDDGTTEVFEQVGHVERYFTLFLGISKSEGEGKLNVRFIVKGIKSFDITNTVEVWMKN